MRVALITGTRESWVARGLRDDVRLVVTWADELVVGDASGIDRLTRELATETGRPVAESVGVADWRRLKLGAGPARNERMVRYAVERARRGAVVRCHGFPGPESVGTWQCLRAAAKAGLETWSHTSLLASRVTSRILGPDPDLTTVSPQTELFGAIQSYSGRRKT